MAQQYPYEDADWLSEDLALKSGGDPQPCPRCHRRGFYAPRFAKPNRRYRACKFCGFWQDVGMPPHPVIRYECTTGNHHVADWKGPDEPWTCPDCGRRFQPDAAVAWPSEDPYHPWRQWPQEGTQANFLAFLRARGYDSPPFGII
jgi:hypothetical protein